MDTGKLLLLSMGGACATAAMAQAQVQSPNILIVMVDQMRADLMPREGYPLRTTPFLDSLAGRGVWFDRAYTTCPASGPARVGLLTGRWSGATHVKSNHNIDEAYYTDDLFDVARERGYRTALVGKNHSHLGKDRTDYMSLYGHGGQDNRNKSAENAEFDRFLGGTKLYAHLEPSPGGVERQLPYRMVDDASQWLESIGTEPFLMWFSCSEPHNPYQVCEPYYSMFPPETLPAMGSTAAHRAVKGEEYRTLAEMMAMGHVGYEENLQRLRSVYHGMLRLIDDQVARLVDELKRLGVYDNTVIVFVSDHGDYVGEYGLMKKGVGMDDALVRIPMQWTGPGIEPRKGAHDAHVSMADIMPTVCEIIGAGIPMGVQGRSLWPMLRGEEYPKEEFSSVMAEDGYGGMYYTKADGTDYIAEGAVHREPGFFDELNTWSQSGTMRMLRMGDWKLVCDMDGNGQLYNLAKDPSEIDNLFHKKRFDDKRNEMMRELLRWELSAADPLPIPRRRYHFKRNPHNYMFNNN